LIVTGQSEAIAKWLEARLGQAFIPPYEAVGILNGKGQRIGAVVLNDYAERNIELTAYGPGAFQRGVIRALARYCFVQLGCNRVTFRTRASNLYVRRVIEKHGAKQEGTLRDWYDDDDAIVYGLLKHECRFLR
jgi:RimJ/RimL family protein N-acetyltransferase